MTLFYTKITIKTICVTYFRFLELTYPLLVTKSLNLQEKFNEFIRYMSPFGIIMTIILIGYGGYYGYNIIKDLYFDKSGEVVEQEAVDEKEVDITDELKDFTKFDANEDEKIAKARKDAEAAAKEREENGYAAPDPTHSDNEEDNTENKETNDPEDASSDENGKENPSVGQDEEVSEQPNDVATKDDISLEDGEADAQQADDAAFSNVINSMKEIGNTPAMSGAMEVDDFEKLDDEQFKEVLFLARKAA